MRRTPSVRPPYRVPLAQSSAVNAVSSRRRRRARSATPPRTRAAPVAVRPATAAPVTGSPPPAAPPPGLVSTGVEPSGEPGEDGGGVDGDGVSSPPAGQVWVRLNVAAVPVMTAVAPVSVHPAGVAIHALLAPLSVTIAPPSAGIVRVTTPPGVPNVAVTETKSPVSLPPGRTNTQTSAPACGPPPKFGSQSFDPYPAAVVGTLPGLTPIAVSAHAGEPAPNPITIAAPAVAARRRSGPAPMASPQV